MILQELNFDDLIQDNKSFEQLKTIGLPTRKMEDYRHINLKDIFQNQLHISNEKNDDFYKQFLSDDFYSLIITNSKPNLSLSKLPNDMKIETKDKQINKDNNALSLLSESFYSDDNILSFDKDIDKPLMIINIFDGENTFFANNLHIDISNNAKIDILEIFASKDMTSAYSSINRTFFINNAKLNYSKLNITSNNDFLNINNKAYINKGDLNICTIEKGSKQSINEYDVFLEEKESSINIYSIIKINQNQDISNTIKINHNNLNTNSNQVFKHILNDSARAVFNSKIIINKDCSNSVAHQNSQTILLDDNARVFNEPRMMIFTDELEASHGATVGSLNEDAINYMKLRGLKQEQCEKMLIEAFANEIYEYIEHEKIKNYILNN